MMREKGYATMMIWFGCYGSWHDDVGCSPPKIDVHNLPLDIDKVSM